MEIEGGQPKVWEIEGDVKRRTKAEMKRRKRGKEKLKEEIMEMEK